MRLGWESGINIEKAITYYPTDRGYQGKQYEQPANRSVSSLMVHIQTYKVVTFMVNVRLIENVVNSQAGKVKVVNAASHTSILGMILMTRYRILPTIARTL